MSTPEWVEMARRQQAEDRAAAKAARDERDATESVEATEILWSEAMTRAAAERQEVHYLDQPGYDRRVFGP